MAGPSLLFDSNVFYAAINISPHGIHPDAEIASRLLEFAHKHDCDVYLAKATEQDINRAGHPRRREASRMHMKQWKVLGDVAVSPDLLRKAGYVPPLSPNDEVDARVLATLAANAAGFSVTQDRGLRDHGCRAGLNERVVGIQGAIELLEQSGTRCSDGEEACGFWGFLELVLLGPTEVKRPHVALCVLLSSRTTRLPWVVSVSAPPKRPRYR